MLWSGLVRWQRAVAPGPAVALCVVTAGCVSLPGARPVDGFVHVPQRSWDGASAPVSVTVPATLDNNRMFVELAFRRPDGRTRMALAWVNMGMGGLSLAPGLCDELGHQSAVSFSIGGMPVTVDAKGVLSASAEDFAQQLGPMPVEATLPAGVLRQFRVTLDYQGHSLTLSRPSNAPASGVAVPIQVSEGTGLISVDARIDGQVYPVVIDSGGGYSWWHGDVVRAWLVPYPDRFRAEGAVGQSNQAMVDQAFEQQGTIVRVPVITLGQLQLHDVGLLGSGPAHGGVVGRMIGRLFWNAWGRGAPGPVVGWLGGNVLHNYRLTIDYRNHVTYWVQTAAAEIDELNSIGISLTHTPTNYLIGGLVRRGGAPSVQDVKVGDTLTAIDGQATASMTRGAIIGALHGNPGDQHRLTLDRSGRTISTDAVVSAY